MKTNQHIEDKDWELIAKAIYDKNPDAATGSEEQAVEDLVADREDREQLLKMTKSVDLYFDLKKYPAEEAWHKVESRIHSQMSTGKTNLRKIIYNPVFRLAAAVLVAAVLLVSGYEVFFTPSATEKMLVISATDQVLNTFTLPDGTLVSLNSDTKVTYPKKFGRNTREVSIEGEAFFEVKPNKNKPFIIHAGKAQIKVLGTSFNVNAYPQLKQVEVIVETGKVQVLNQVAETTRTNELILTPGDKGTLVFSSNSLLKTTNQDPNFLAWKTHNLIFKATSLSEVIENLEKVYKVKIRLADSKLSGLLLTAQFNNYSLDFILKVIETTFQIEARNINGQYILKARS
ncbi:MAG: FecR domain-containing protein [Prolixibacteraceae bacterium]|jgi:ferric-dicitrate binding protein FerR (iron transport regulator)